MKLIRQQGDHLKDYLSIQVYAVVDSALLSIIHYAFITKIMIINPLVDETSRHTCSNCCY